MITELGELARQLDFTWVGVPATSPFSGHRLDELRIRTRLGASVVGIIRSGSLLANPDGKRPCRREISWRTKDIDFSVRGLLKRARESRESAIRRQPCVPPRLAKAERYTPERKGQFLLGNAATAAEYRVARREVKSLGLNPDAIPHVRPTSR